LRLKASSPVWNGTDDFGFSALPGGNRHSNGNLFYAGSSGFWWSDTEDSATGGAYGRGMRTDNDDVLELIGNKTIGYSVRCLRND